jgi:hypothetical protein
MSQKSSSLQPAESVSQALTLDTPVGAGRCRAPCAMPENEDGLSRAVPRLSSCGIVRLSEQVVGAFKSHKVFALLRSAKRPGGDGVRK